MLSQVHRRYNPLRDTWVLCSPHRTSRPWQGAEEETNLEKKPEFDPKCYLCPGNTRANGEEMPKYSTTYAFVNDFAAINPFKETEESESSDTNLLDNSLFKAEPVHGECQVICFSPKHNVTLADMTPQEIEKVVEAWQDIYRKGQANKTVEYCQIFENKGSAMGCSNPHPHGQAWMSSVIPDEPWIEHVCLENYHKKHGTHMLEDYVLKELKDGSRIIDENETFVSMVPFWATWPFETMLVSKQRIRNICELTDSQKSDLASILSKLTIRYDNLFKTSFPYSMGIHQQFVGGNYSDVEHLMFHFYPPLLRSATVRKFLVGFELLGMPQRDITPESAAASLRACDVVHFRVASEAAT